MAADQLRAKVMTGTWEPCVLAARGVQRASSHGFGVRELLEMAAVMGKLPETVELWGIEIASTEPGQGLSPEMVAAVDGVWSNGPSNALSFSRKLGCYLFLFRKKLWR